jgi:predicted nuclease of predicted toxin-antitoxin system
VTLRFMLDEDISDRVAVGLRDRGIDTVSVHELGRDNRRIPDDVQLEYAVGQGRVLVTYNRGDFQLLDAKWREEGRVHAGILWCLEQTISRQDVGSLIRALQTASEEFDTLEGLCLILQRSHE